MTNAASLSWELELYPEGNGEPQEDFEQSEMRAVWDLGESFSLLLHGGGSNQVGSGCCASSSSSRQLGLGRAPW